MQIACFQTLVHPKAHSRSRPGFSLVETLVGISLLGVVLVPMLFMSSSYFLNQLNTTRQSMEVSHNSSQFLNRFMEELYQASRILSSDATHLYFAYYDVSTQREVKTGYQLTTVGSNRILEKLIYNSATSNWDAISPYGETDANRLLLPSTAIFTYCQDSATPCAATSVSQSALLVRLSGWSFKNSANTQSLNLPDIDVYIAAGASSTDNAILSNVPQEMYNIDATSAFGSNADLKLLNISPFTGQLNDALVTPAPASGVLSTIYTGTDDAYYSMQVASDGRLYTGAAWMTNTGSYITYHPSTGISTILSGIKGPGNYYTSAISPLDGRVYFASTGSTGKVWTWHPSTGLSTVIGTSESSPGKAAMAVANNGRVYIGSSAGKFWTYTTTAGLNTITLPAGTTNTGAYLNVVTSPVDNRVYFSGKNSSGYWVFFTWDPVSGNTVQIPLTISGQIVCGDASCTLRQSLAVNPVTGGVYIADNLEDNSYMYYWEPSMGTGTITKINSTARQAIGYTNALAVAADGRVFFGENAVDSSSTPGNAVWTWKPGDGAATSIFNSTNTNPGYGVLTVTRNGNSTFFASGDWTQFNDHLYTWKSGGSWTTIPVYDGIDLAIGNEPARVDTMTQSHAFLLRQDGRVFFSDGRSGKSGMWTWAEATGLSTIWMSPVSGGYPGHTAMTVDDNGRLYFSGDTRDLGGDMTNSQPMFTWHESTGLSTIIGTGEDCFGTYGQMGSIPGSTGGVYFMGLGDNSAHGYPIWRWTPGTSSFGIKRATEVGAPNLKTITFAKNGIGTYAASAFDSDGNLFYVDTTNKTVDRYTSTTDTSGAINYTLTAQFNWGTWASSINAMAVDESSTQIALLDNGNKQVDIFDNRLVSGTPNAPTSFSISSQTALPTGLAISNRTGNYLVLDSTVRNADSTHPYKYINLNIYAASTHAYLRSIPITVEGGGTNGRLSIDATAETNFKIALDVRRNVLYLAVPSLGKIFALSMPEYL
jgi:hypothetical protein